MLGAGLFDGVLPYCSHFAIYPGMAENITPWSSTDSSDMFGIFGWGISGSSSSCEVTEEDFLKDGS